MAGITDSLQLVGTTIADKYAVESVVGEGGFAIVYKAKHLIWKRPVAIKAFKAMGTFGESDRERLLASFVQEGQLLADLSERSAAICQARDVATLTTPKGDWVPYMVLEWLEGVTLERAIADDKAANRPLRTPQQALALLEPVAEALALAHVKGIAHRDVKPGNIFLLGDPRSESCPVKLLDFGIAKVVQDAQKMAGAFSQTTGQVTSFTPAYGAPEQFSRAQGATGPWTDVFALALIFSEIVTGKDPLEGDDVAQLAYASMDEKRRPTPRTLGVNVPDAVERVLAKALSVATTSRYGTAGEFWNALRGAFGQAPLRAITGGGVSTTGPQPASGNTTVPLSPDNTPSRSQSFASATRTTSGTSRASGKSGLFIGAAVGIVAIGGGVFLFGRSHGDAPVAGPDTHPAAPAAVAVPKVETCPDGMLKIPGGKFFMGSDDRDAVEAEHPSHQVTLSPYCIDKYEVTVDRYKVCSDKGECKRAGVENEWDGITAADRKSFDGLCNARDPESRAKHPINCVDWEQAASFCKAAGGRLPTEAEWEFAARGPDGRKYPWGDDDPQGHRLNACGKECVAWGKKNHVDEEAMYQVDDGFANTAPVGSFPAGASRYGVEDVVGNVWEWVADWSAPYSAANRENPKGPEKDDGSSGRVIRGGAWNGAYPAWVRPTFRYHASASTRSYGYGFRCASDVALK